MRFPIRKPSRLRLHLRFFSGTVRNFLPLHLDLSLARFGWSGNRGGIGVFSFIIDSRVTCHTSQSGDQSYIAKEIHLPFSKSEKTRRSIERWRTSIVLVQVYRYRLPLEVDVIFEKNGRRMKLLLVALLLTLTLAGAYGQIRYEPFGEKPGSCPPALPVQICSQYCSSDSQCLGAEKCCSTNCGGFVCSKPVTMRQPTRQEKPGSCPAVPKGRWVCSPTCSGDNDCRGTLKCCKNRCGALACQKPDVEVVESVELPTPDIPENPNNFPRNPYNVNRNPYEFPRNPNLYPSYFYNN